MKRSLLLLLAIAMLCSLALTGCSDTGNLVGTVGVDGEPTEEPAAEPTPDPAEGMAASVAMNDAVDYYPTFAEAWNAANGNTGVEATVTLLADACGDFDELFMEARTAPLTLDLNGHSLDRGLTTAAHNGAVFNLQNPGTLIVKNGTVTGGNCYEHGGCFYIGTEGLDLTLENLTITGNHCTKNGSAVYLAPCKSTVTLDNVTITDNSADESGAVFWAIDGTSRATLVFKNKVEITGNTGSGNLNNLVYDGHGWSGWLNTDSMDASSQVGVSYSDGYGGPLADSFGARVEELKACFVCDQSDHDIAVYGDRLVCKFKTDKLAMIQNGEWFLYSTFNQAWSAATWYGDYNITLCLLTDIGPEEMSEVGELTVPEREESLTLDLNGHSLDRGLTTATHNGAVFNLQNPGTLIVKNGTVTGGNCYEHGGCFYIGTEGLDLTLENLTITGNHCTKNGSAVYLAPCKSTVTLDNVTITDNSADESGAVFWAIDGTSRATLVFKNKVEITGNTGSGNLNNLVYDGHGWCGWLNTDSMDASSQVGVSYFDGYGGPLADSFGARVEELKACFVCDQSDHDIAVYGDRLVCKFKNHVAAVINNGEWALYDTFAQAWATANGSETRNESIMVLFGDWIADSNGSLDDKGSYGADCYHFTGGALYPREREEDTWLKVDLNGHTIDRGLYDPDKKINITKDKGCIFYLDGHSDDVHLEIMNGTLTGGNNSGDGGAIFTTGVIGYISQGTPEDIVLTNVTVTKNRSGGNGGGINAGRCALTVRDSTITGNYCCGRGGGIYVKDYGFGATVAGTVNITGNRSQNYAADNVYMDNGQQYLIATELDYQTSKIGTAKERRGVNVADIGDGVAKVESADSQILEAFSNDQGETYTIVKKSYSRYGYMVCYK